MSVLDDYLVDPKLSLLGAAQRALHDSSVAGEDDFAAARRGNVEIGLADQ